MIETYLKVHHELLQEKQLKLLEWSTQSADLSIIENLCIHFKHAVHARWPKKISELGYMMNIDDVHHSVGQSLVT